MSRTMMMVSVRLAFFCVGSRKALTPLETASTPVIAVHPLAKTLARSQRESIDALTGRRGGATIAHRVTARRYGAQRSDHDHDQKRADEEVSGDEKGRASVLYPAHVDQGKNRAGWRGTGRGCAVGAGERPRPARPPPRRCRRQRSGCSRSSALRRPVGRHSRRGSQTRRCSCRPRADRRRWSAGRR